MRILVGGMVRQVPEVLRAHIETLQWQDVPQDVELDFMWIDDNDDPEATQLLFDAGGLVQRAGERGGAEYAVGSDTHHWNIPAFHRLAFEKQRILAHARAARYDAVWLVDSDLMCGKDTLRSLLAADKEVVSAVFWTQWSPNDAYLPQVWQVHPYGFEGAGWTQATFLRELELRQLVRVRGLGACTLIRTTALEKGVGFWPLIEGLPTHGMWQGEDRHFCVAAQRAHVELWADAWPKVWHCYRPEDRAKLPVVLEDLRNAGADGWVSLVIEPCTEPALALHKEHVRGQLGSLQVVAEIEKAARELEVGDAKFVTAYFPPSWPLAEYQHTWRTLRVWRAA